MKRAFTLITTIIISLALYSCGTNFPVTYQPLQQNSNVSAYNRDLLSTMLGDSPNFSQIGNGSFISVISREYGRGAKAGAIVEFLYPYYSVDRLWDAYDGIYYDGKFKWAHDMKLIKQSIIPDSGIIISDFSDNKIRLTLKDVAVPKLDVLFRDVQITNTSSTPISDFKHFFYEYLRVNLVAGDTVEYDKINNCLLHYNDNIYFAVGTDSNADQWQCGMTLNYIPTFLTKSQDARIDSEDGKLCGNLTAKGLGVNGSLRNNVGTLNPGQTIHITVYMAAGQSKDAVLKALKFARSSPFNKYEAEEKSFWQKWLSRAKMPSADQKIIDVYRRALIVMKQSTCDNGAILAAPTKYNPPYKFTWPRDGAFISLAYMKNGYMEEAKNFFDFMAGVQKPDGGWCINYYADKRHFWDIGENEHDQAGTIPWGIYQYYLVTKDINWLTSKWSTIRKACDFLITKTAPNHLIKESRDLWEEHQDKSWTYSNAAVYAGFVAGSEIADKLGYPLEAKKYKEAADALKDAIYNILWINDGGYFSKGLNLDINLNDRNVESANLALSYPFNVFAPNEPRMKSTADKIASTLVSPMGGIRRYSTDKSYDGQPWPVCTAWLAIYYNQLGDKAKAAQLFQTVTNYAYKTDSLQLGEQFDESKGIWVSALPLVWSEAKYVLAALELF